MGANILTDKEKRELASLLDDLDTSSVKAPSMEKQIRTQVKAHFSGLREDLSMIASDHDVASVGKKVLDGLEAHALKTILGELKK